MTKEERDALKALCDAATPGEWSAERLARHLLQSDAEFIAAARTAVPKLLAHVAALEAAAGDAVAALNLVRHHTLVPFGKPVRGFGEIADALAALAGGQHE